MKREKVLRRQGRKLHRHQRPSFLELVGRTMLKYSSRLADTVYSNNAILKRLMDL